MALSNAVAGPQSALLATLQPFRNGRTHTLRFDRSIHFSHTMRHSGQWQLFSVRAQKLSVIGVVQAQDAGDHGR
jgi:hypothetical protein